ncbi:lysophospholipid acyltransferase family protein [Planctomicrobium piriforme]|uniref:KDO2-lipid IV(A) lauroyltransferase n=1 Tax=Planctomicrobium piriforme TaxID=1576369 RepID=A0A1I3D3K5_9PLAN|nr:lysophospholipid acyltransferase family protein [Planctomicrobium piriforme]SFH81292.1 KDO2-lipid IV(A) lauroyltransferase [Planctomicrobium piriforme]
MTFREVRWSLEYVGFRTLACVIEILSPRQLQRLALALSWLFVRVLPRRLTRYDVASENLRAAFGQELSSAEIDSIIRGMWIHLFRLVAEMIQFPRKFRLENCRQVLVFRNRAAGVKAMLSGRPVFLVGGHYGNWEASTATFGQFGFRMGMVARELDNPYLHRWFAKARESTGHQLLLKDGGWDGMLDIVQAGGNLGLLCDQDAGKRGVFVNFFGRPASTYRSIALLALEHKAIIVVGYGRRLPDDFDTARWSRFEIGCEDIIDVTEIEAEDEVRAVTERYSAALERAIRRSPEQYFWVHRRWKSVPKQKTASLNRKAG